MNLDVSTSITSDFVTLLELYDACCSMIEHQDQDIARLRARKRELRAQLLPYMLEARSPNSTTPRPFWAVGGSLLVLHADGHGIDRLISTSTHQGGTAP